jgi:hypothetical protein
MKIDGPKVCTMYGRVQVMWDDVFGEPEGVRSADWAWRCSYNCFKSTRSVERLYCKRQIQCLASSKILTPPRPPPPPPTEWVPPPPRLWCGGEDTLDGSRGGWGVNILEDARHSSVLYKCKYCNHVHHS